MANTAAAKIEGMLIAETDMGTEQVTICRGKTICSAAPALEDLELSAEVLFA